MEKQFVKQVGTEVSFNKNMGDGQQKTVHLVMPCEAGDRGAIEYSPVNCIAHELWNNSRDLWHIHRYRIVDAVPAQFKTTVRWATFPLQQLPKTQAIDSPTGLVDMG